MTRKPLFCISCCWMVTEDSRRSHIKAMRVELVGEKGAPLNGHVMEVHWSYSTSTCMEVQWGYSTWTCMEIQWDCMKGCIPDGVVHLLGLPRFTLLHVVQLPKQREQHLLKETISE